MDLTGETIEIPVQIGERARQEVLEAADPWDARHLYLNIEDISGETNPGTVYRMYLNLPPDPGPEELERHYLGELSFFGLERAAQPKGDAHPHGMRFSVEVGDLIRILRDDSDWDREQLRLRLKPVVPKPPAGVSDAEAEELLAPYRSGHEPVNIGRVSLSIDA
jgi:tyrosinase